MSAETYEESVAELESEMDSMSKRLRILEQTVESLRSLGEEFWRKEAAIYLLGLKATSWLWRATDPDEVFTEMFPPESLADGTSLRWVKGSGEIETTIAINRARQLVFRLETAHFAAPELANSLKLEIDGKEVPWSVRGGTSWIARVPDNPSETRLRFRLSVDISAIPQGKNVSFSLKEVRIESGRPPADETVRPIHDRPPLEEMLGPELFAADGGDLEIAASRIDSKRLETRARHDRDRPDVTAH